MEFLEDPKHQNYYSYSLMYNKNQSMATPFDQGMVGHSDKNRFTVEIDNYAHYTFDEYRRRAEGYLSWIGATQDISGLWDYEGDIECLPETFLVYNGQLTVSFGKISGYFMCNGMGLISLIGIPTECQEFHISSNNITEIDYLPISYAYDLSHNQITFIKDNAFCNYANHIDISNNHLVFLPNMKSLYLQLFDCSFNRLTHLTTAPFANRFLANSNKLTEFTNNDRILFNTPIQYLDISYNYFQTLVGIPPVKNLVAGQNFILKSLKGLDDAYNLFNDPKELKEIFTDIDFSGSLIESLDYLPKYSYRVGVTGTKITNLKSNTCESVYYLIAEKCNDLKLNTKPDFKIYELHTSPNEHDRGFKPISKKVHNITYKADSMLITTSHEIEFYNTTGKNAKIENKFRENYHLMFLKFLYDNKYISKKTPGVTIDNYHWPKGFEETIRNSAKSLESVAKFAL